MANNAKANKTYINVAYIVPNKHRDCGLSKQGGGESLDCGGFVLVIGKHMFLISVFWYAVRPAADSFLSHIAAFFLSPAHPHICSNITSCYRKKVTPKIKLLKCIF